jgi:hypothetical protein
MRCTREFKLLYPPKALEGAHQLVGVDPVAGSS